MSKNVLKYAKNHFHTRNSKLEKVTVKEWLDDDGKPVEIFYKPASNLKISERIIELTQQNKLAEATAMNFVLKARDKDGKLMFQDLDVDEVMMECDSAVIGDIVKSMNQDQVDEKDMEKN